MIPLSWVIIRPNVPAYLNSVMVVGLFLLLGAVLAVQLMLFESLVSLCEEPGDATFSDQ